MRSYWLWWNRLSALDASGCIEESGVRCLCTSTVKVNILQFGSWRRRQGSVTPSPDRYSHICTDQGYRDSKIILLSITHRDFNLDYICFSIDWSWKSRCHSLPTDPSLVEAVMLLHGDDISDKSSWLKWRYLVPKYPESRGKWRIIATFR